jgi:hypothetical protein
MLVHFSVVESQVITVNVVQHFFVILASVSVVASVCACRTLNNGSRNADSGPLCGHLTRIR